MRFHQWWEEDHKTQGDRETQEDPPWEAEKIRQYPNGKSNVQLIRYVLENSMTVAKIEIVASFSERRKMTIPTHPDPDTANQLRRKVQEGSVNAEDHARLGGLLFLAGNLQEAVTVFQRAIDLAQTNLGKARVCIDFGWVYYEIEHLEEARTLAQQALGLLATEADCPELFACRGASQTLIAQLEGINDPESGRRAAQVALNTLEKVLEEGSRFEGKATANFDAAILY